MDRLMGLLVGSFNKLLDSIAKEIDLKGRNRPIYQKFKFLPRNDARFRHEIEFSNEQLDFAVIFSDKLSLEVGIESSDCFLETKVPIKQSSLPFFFRNKSLIIDPQPIYKFCVTEPCFYNAVKIIRNTFLYLTFRFTFDDGKTERTLFGKTDEFLFVKDTNVNWRDSLVVDADYGDLTCALVRLRIKRSKERRHAKKSLMENTDITTFLLEDLEKLKKKEE